MGDKPYSWIARHRRPVILTVVAAIAVGALGVWIWIYSPIAARDRMLRRGDALVQAIPAPADGHVMYRVSTRRDGVTGLPFTHYPASLDTWAAGFDLDTGDSSAHIESAYAALLAQAGWRRDPVGAQSDCWTKDGFGISVSANDALHPGEVWLEVKMSRLPCGADA